MDKWIIGVNHNVGDFIYQDVLPKERKKFAVWIPAAGRRSEGQSVEGKAEGEVKIGNGCCILNGPILRMFGDIIADKISDSGTGKDIRKPVLIVVNPGRANQCCDRVPTDFPVNIINVVSHDSAESKRQS